MKATLRGSGSEAVWGRPAGSLSGTTTFLVGTIAGDGHLPAELSRAFGAAVGLHGGWPRQDYRSDRSVVASFAGAGVAARCASAISRRWAATAASESVDVGLALHTGEVGGVGDGADVASLLDRCAALSKLAHGGQILMSRVTADLVRAALPGDTDVIDHGVHTLAWPVDAEHVFELRERAEGRTFPPLRDASGIGPPPVVTRFLGRRDEVERLVALLSSSKLVTLTGAGGSGKTRLARETVVDMASIRVWWADLASISDPAHVEAVLLSAAGLREVLGRTAVDLVVDAVEDDVVIVLDNCEHVLAAAAETAERIIVRSSARIIATSREPLGVAGETIFAVPPLDVPASDMTTVPEVSESTAVQLLIDRGALSSPGFRLDDTNVRDVVTISRRLDGIPLAIELAATQLRQMSPAAIAAELDDRFALLGATSRRGLPRQRTLEASVAWSEDLLDDTERAVFRRLSVFAGAFDVAAAAAVAGVNVASPAAVVRQLADRSLLVVEQGSLSPRYRMLETIRAYAAQRLVGAEEADVTRGRHLDHFVALAEEAAPALEAGGFVLWSDRLSRVHDDLRAAMEWAIHTAQFEQLGRLVGGLWLYWSGRGHVHEGMDQCMVALDHSLSAELRARVLITLADLATLAGEPTRAATAALDASFIAEDIGDLRLAGRARTVLGGATAFGGHGDRASARGLFLDAMPLHEAAQDHYFVADCLLGLAITYIAEGALADAARSADRALTVSSDSGNEIGRMGALYFSGWAQFLLGDDDRAERCLDEAIERARVLRDPFWETLALAIRGAVAVQLGELDPAEAILHEAIELGARAMNPYAVGWAQMHLGMCRRAGGHDGLAELGAAKVTLSLAGVSMALPVVSALVGEDHADGGRSPLDRGHVQLVASGRAIDAGRPKDALWSAQEAVMLFNEIGHRPGLVAALELVAVPSASLGRPELAASVFAFTERHHTWVRAWLGSSCDRWRDAAVHRARDAMGVAAYNQAWDTGRSLGEREVVALVRRGRGPRRRPPSGWGSLTPTEEEVVRFVAEGLRNADIATRLLIAPGTVKVHLTRIFTKLGVASRAELVAMAAKRARP